MVAWLVAWECISVTCLHSLLCAPEPGGQNHVWALEGPYAGKQYSQQHRLPAKSVTPGTAMNPNPSISQLHRDPPSNILPRHVSIQN